MLAKALSAATAAAAEKLYVEDVFSTWLYTGTGSAQTITNGIDLAGEGGLVWIKDRSQAADHVIYDTSIGRSTFRFSNRTDADVSNTSSGEGLTTFNVDGFSLGFNRWEENINSRNYASWTFRKAAKFFDVVTFNYAGSGNIRVSHSLGSVPGCIIIKYVGAASDWYVYHRSRGRNYYSRLNSTSAEFNVSNVWDTTDPTSTDFGISAYLLQAGTWVAYVFAHDASGFGDAGDQSVIKCGSYTGNSSTSGPVVDLGWEPQWVLMKNANSPGSYWTMFDNMRGVVTNGTTLDDARLMPHDSSAETLTNALSLTSTGFQITNSSADYNESGSTHIYIAIRRGPMKTPTDATTVFKAVAQTSRGTVSTDFPVDMVIMGDRPTTWGNNWSVQDRLRGKTAALTTSKSDAERTTSLSTFDSNTSFTDGSVSGGTSAIYETFRRAPGFFDVVAYTGNGSISDRNITHNLQVRPEMAIIKSRSAAQSWPVWHKSITGGGTYGTNYNMYLNFTLGRSLGQDFSVDGNTDFTASTFPVMNAGTSNTNGQTYIAYLFASCPGVSKVGSYTGTGTTKQIDCGFTAGARFVLIKRTDSTGDWYVWDTARGIVSGNDPYLLLNSTAAEVTSTDYIDPYSAGFEISSTAPAAINANGGSFIFLAVA